VVHPTGAATRDECVGILPRTAGEIRRERGHDVHGRLGGVGAEHGQIRPSPSALTKSRQPGFSISPSWGLNEVSAPPAFVVPRKAWGCAIISNSRGCVTYKCLSTREKSISGFRASSVVLRFSSSVVGADRSWRWRIGSDRGSGDGGITVWRPVAFPMLESIRHDRPDARSLSDPRLDRRRIIA
jgi:hypothetical protein